MLDSVAIAAELERRHPSPALPGIPGMSLTPGAASSPAMAAKTAEYTEQLAPRLFRPFGGLLTLRIVMDVVTDISRPLRQQRAEETRGATMEQLQASANVSEVLAQAAPALREIGELWGREGGPFAMGMQISWMDVLLASVLQFARRCDEDLFQGIRAVEGAENVTRLYDTVLERGWLARDDH